METAVEIFALHRDRIPGSADRFVERLQKLGKDETEARSLVSMCVSEPETISSLNLLGWCHYFGVGIVQDKSEALRLWQRSATLGDPVGMDNVGFCYYWGHGTEQDHVTASDWFRRSADLGNRVGMYDLACCYREGTGVERNPVTAVEWFRRSADLGHPVSMVSLAKAYDQGLGVAVNAESATHWYQKAATLGDTEAMFYLARRYEEGLGVEPSLETAVEWYLRGATLEDLDTMYNLGVCYQYGTGVEANTRIAFEWFTKGAHLGCCDAMRAVGKCYEEGSGVEANAQIAVQWYTKSADLGDSVAMACLGDCYRDGFGVDRDPTIALEWYRRANTQHGWFQAGILLATTAPAPLSALKAWSQAETLSTTDEERRACREQMVTFLSNQERALEVVRWAIQNEAEVTALRSRVTELETANESLRTELDYRPGGHGYLTAETSFRDTIQLVRTEGVGLDVERPPTLVPKPEGVLVGSRQDPDVDEVEPHAVDGGAPGPGLHLERLSAVDHRHGTVGHVPVLTDDVETDVEPPGAQDRTQTQRHILRSVRVE